MKKQKTINSEIEIKGIGLHTGNMTTMLFKPAPANYGIKFRRTDVKGEPIIEASLENVRDIIRGTTLANGDIKVHTIEHILAACSALEIDNLEICLTNNEPPVLDGSAIIFTEKNSKNRIKRTRFSKKMLYT